jgi:hypothetical protein
MHILVLLEVVVKIRLDEFSNKTLDCSVEAFFPRAVKSIILDAVGEM